MAASEAAHLVVDAVADDDLATIARAGRDMALMTGGSALAAPLPGLYREAGLLEASAFETEAPEVGPGAVVLSGSCSAMTRAQVAAYGGPSWRFDPLALARDGYGEALDWLVSQDFGKAPLVYATAEPEQVRAAQAELGVEHAGAVVEEALAALAIAAREAGARRFVVAGGETSGAVTKALGVTRLDVGPEIAPGVPWCFCQSGGKQVALALKSGNFGRESFFADALGKLEAA